MTSLALLELFFPGEAQDEGLQQFVSLWLDFFTQHAEEVLPVIGRLVSIHGAVLRVHSPQPLVQRLAFECAKCGSRTVKLLTDGRVQEVATSPESSYQGESPEEAARPLAGGIRPAATIDCELTGFLVGQCKPGDRVCITGIVQACQSSAVSAHLANPHAVDGATVARRPLPWRDFTASAVAQEDEDEAETARDCAFGAKADASAHAGEGQETDVAAAAAAQAGDRLMEFIADAYTLEPRRFELLVASIAPSIVGRHIVKAGLLLALLGGVPVTYSQSQGGPWDVGGALQRRGTIHVLLLGDAGVGKSRLLQAAAAAASSSTSTRSNAAGGSMRSVFVCGNTASAAGLTAAAVREAGTGELIIEAGALVLADGGVCCIDELDKMPAAAALTGDSASLLEAMEQQTVTIAKASCSCCLPARTTLLAAANPKEGRFDPRKPLAENINLSAPLLSRFDLIFLLHDKPAAAADARLAAHVFSSSHSKLHPAAAGIPAPPATASPTGESTGGTSCLEDRLMALESGDLLPLSLLQDYIYYAREHVHPRLSVEAASVLKMYYLTLRKQQQQHHQQQGLRVATRQLESLIRLCQEAMKCASLLVSRAQAAVPAEAVVAAANETGLLLKREGKWVIDRSLLAQF
ncbi:DNA helicase MCM8 [Cyclospora cayetanensis]|uniref:DNA helicase n=1 Tax=Cyclospora cayetanensis TaxID=88456 RepID=A0A6P6RT66_9EIME|nr:DNA helicase MCM8 [Cyclospora cayetanensis]